MKLEVPDFLAHLPMDKHGRPVPWFVAKIKGQWDFRVIRPGGIEIALGQSLCWVCGEKMNPDIVGRRLGHFVIGPMCAVNRVSAEPPSHLQCAAFSAQYCPFLSTPSMVRRENGLPENRVAPAGKMIARNPGVTLVWSTVTWEPFRIPDGGMLFDVGEPLKVSWWTEGRAATRQEILDSIQSGMPALVKAANQEGAEALMHLSMLEEKALRLVPAA